MTANILLVDDRPKNLLALEAILEPLGHNLVSVDSGDAALKELLQRDFACILLDVQMPELDGFETAELIKQRQRTSHIPIIFLTAISKEEQHVFRGYSAGAVDYLFKPFNPDILRSKVAVFIELWEKTEQLRMQAELLREQELGALRRESEERYRQLADAMPQIVWTADTDGNASYFNRQWFEYTGMSEEDAGPAAWHLVTHPDDLPGVAAKLEQTLRTGAVFEAEHRIRNGEGAYRWHLVRAVPIRDDSGSIAFWIGTATDIHDRKQIEEQRAFIVEASAVLGGSLDYRKTLADVAQLAVPQIADWCAVDVVEDDGSIHQLAIAHSDPAKVTFARELQQRYPPDPAAETGAAAVIRSGEPELVPEMSDEVLAALAADELHLDLIRELGLRSYMCVPLKARGRVLGAISFVAAESERSFGGNDLLLAEELARRAATAVDNAQLHRETEERAQAARVLATIGDGVVLIDSDGIVRLWNPAAEAIAGLRAEDVVGRPADEALPGFAQSVPRVPVASAPARPTVTETVPVEIGGRELWLSISGVTFSDGIVYAFRSLTEERALDELKGEFIATVSHELRTPLAAIYGSAQTLLREDVEFEESDKKRLLDVIAHESERLSRIADDILFANKLDSGQLALGENGIDLRALARDVVEEMRGCFAAREDISFELTVPDALDSVAGDPDRLRQVLINLIDNAVKYSPDGGRVEVAVESRDGGVRIAVRDQGIGIAPLEQRRIFGKFYRVDPGLARGVGGTGLGLYICRELVRRMDGRLSVSSEEGKGSTFAVDLPVATAAGKDAAAVAQTA